MSSMMDFCNTEEIENALEEALNGRRLMLEEIRKLDNYILFLQYYLTTGEALNPDAIDLPGSDEDVE